MSERKRIIGKDYFTQSEWNALPRVGSSGSSMVQQNACIHGILLGESCQYCKQAEREYRRKNRGKH